MKTPGVYEFCHNPLPQEVIKRAGGTHLPASLSILAEDLTIASGLKVTLGMDGSRWNLIKTEMSGFYKVTLQIPISLNQESEEGLESIPGIGPRLAKAIVHERSKRGGFKTLDELITVPGMGHNLVQKIRPLIKL
ncbi:MAG: helix-hairpin-helix domain-containing protein [Pseudomonadota bacterium]